MNAAMDEGPYAWTQADMFVDNYLDKCVMQNNISMSEYSIGMGHKFIDPQCGRKCPQFGGDKILHRKAIYAFAVACVLRKFLVLAKPLKLC